MLLSLASFALLCVPAAALTFHAATNSPTVRPAVGDGKRWIAWTSSTGQFQVVDTARSTRRSLEQTGCYTDAVAFGRLLLNCASPNPGPRALNLATGDLFAPTAGQPPDFTSGFDPSRDSFGDLGRYWLIGFRSSDDPHVQGHTIYLNLRDGHLSQADGVRNLDTPGLDRVRRSHCSDLAETKVRYGLRFGPLGSTRPLRLISCRDGSSRVVSRCRRGCQALGPNQSTDVLVWLEGRSAVRAVRPATGRVYSWRLPRQAPTQPPLVQAAQAGGQLYISRPEAAADGTSTWRIYRATIPRH